MRSRADGRIALEWLLRAALVAALAVALWRSMQPRAEVVRAHRTDARSLPAALAAATRDREVASLDVLLDSTPSRAERAWLRALRGAGVAVHWRGGPPPLAAQVERSPEPESRVRVTVAADSGAVALADSAGPLDTVRAGRGGASVEASTVVGAVRAARGRFAAERAVPAAVAPRAVLVLGRAGWEARFVAAALAEAGWTVRSRQPAAPGVVVADAGVLPIDTGRYAAVVVLDSSAADLAPALARFAGQGGGLVLAGGTAALAPLWPLAPARSAARLPGRIVLDADSVTRPDLPRRALTAVRADAVRLEGTAADPVVAVRRAGLARVITVGYDDTWRWRMLGGAGGLAAHRAWWSRLVGLVSPASADSVASAGDAAPLAALVDALGPPERQGAAPAPASRDEPLPLAWLALLAALLLAETASRRFRGAR